MTRASIFHTWAVHGAVINLQMHVHEISQASMRRQDDNANVIQYTVRPTKDTAFVYAAFSMFQFISWQTWWDNVTSATRLLSKRDGGLSLGRRLAAIRDCDLAESTHPLLWEGQQCGHWHGPGFCSVRNASTYRSYANVSTIKWFSYCGG